jgi:hypothetical protein
MIPDWCHRPESRMRLLASGLLVGLGLVLGAGEAPAQSGIFSIFLKPQQQDIEPQADAEDDAPLAAPPVSALEAPDLPLPPRRAPVVSRPAAPTAPPLPFIVVPPLSAAPPVAPMAASPVARPVPVPPPAGAIAAAPDLPVPPRRPGVPETSQEPEPAPEPVPEPAPAPESPVGKALMPVEPDAFSDRPSMMVSLPFPGFRPMQQPPLQQQETTTEEIEQEEQRTPEPMQVEKQTDHVDISCLKPELIALVRRAGDRFGATPVITSGQRYRGRIGSYHRKCMAADFFVPGVARADLARYLRGLPEAGGVGTYCHTKSVHIDIGEPRNWSQCGFRFRFSQRG